MPKKEISDLYWQRWNCELDIRSIKHSLRMDVLRCKTPEMVRKEIWCHMLAYNLLRGTMVESAKRHDVLPRQLSVKGAMQAVESFTPAMMAIDGNEAVLLQCHADYGFWPIALRIDSGPARAPF